MTYSINPYRNLEERTLLFAKEVLRMCQSLPKGTINHRLVDQLIRSAGSIGANYREANDAISKRDFIHRLRIARKEAKETSYWLDLIREANPERDDLMLTLRKETIELRNILSAIIQKSVAKGVERV
jgi:four helix bundle protein